MNSPHGKVWCASAVFAAAATLATYADQQRPPVFRGGTTFVSVDAYPRRDGAFIDNLTKADFTVLEDGRPQTIDTFELVRFEPNPVDALRIDPSSMNDAERQAADPHGRLFVVYLDVYHVTRDGSRDVRRPVVDFLNRTITAADLFAVTTPNALARALTFARRTDTIERELTEHWDWGRGGRATDMLEEPGEQHAFTCASVEFPRADQQRIVGAIVARFREDLLYSSLEHLTTYLGELRDERKNILFLSEGWSPEGPLQIGPADGKVPQAPTVGVGRGGRLGRLPADNVLTSAGDALDDDCRALNRRLLDMDFAERFDRLIGAAARANITFYPVDVGRLKTGVAAHSTLRTLAEANGGMAIVNTNDLNAGFRRISDDVSAYYLLGYYSSNENRDGAFRKIEVRVGGKPVTARRGYFAFPMPAPPAPRAIPAGVPDALETLGRLDAHQDVFGYAAARPDGIDLVVDLATREIDRGRWTNGARVAIAASRGVTGSVPVTAVIEPGRRSVQVRLPAGAASGEARIDIEVTGDGEAATASVPVEAPATTPIGPPNVFRGTASGRAPLQPVAEFLFHRRERLHVEWPLPEDPPERSVRVLDRRGQPLPFEVGVGGQTADGHPAITADVLLAGFADGDYVLEAVAGSGEGAPRALFAFRVIR